MGCGVVEGCRGQLQYLVLFFWGGEARERGATQVTMSPAQSTPSKALNPDLPPAPPTRSTPSPHWPHTVGPGHTLVLVPVTCSDHLSHIFTLFPGGE